MRAFRPTAIIPTTLATASLLAVLGGCGGGYGGGVGAGTNQFGIVNGTYNVVVNKPGQDSGVTTADDVTENFTMVINGATATANINNVAGDETGTITATTVTLGASNFVALTITFSNASVYRFLRSGSTALELGTSSEPDHRGAVISASLQGQSAPGEGTLAAGSLHERTYTMTLTQITGTTPAADPDTNNVFVTDQDSAEPAADEEFDDESDGAGTAAADDGTFRQQNAIAVFTRNNGDTYVGIVAVNGALEVISVLRGTYTRTDDTGGVFSAVVSNGAGNLTKPRANN